MVCRIEEQSPLMSAVLFAGWLAVGATWIGILLKICGDSLISLLKRREWRETSARGFEVKLNTGPEPVLTQKENDHG
jgi:hypothetical protein